MIVFSFRIGVVCVSNRLKYLSFFCIVFFISCIEDDGVNYCWRCK